MNSDNLKQLITNSIFKFVPTLAYELSGYGIAKHIRYNILDLLKDVGVTELSIEDSFISSNEKQLEIEFLNAKNDSPDAVLKIILSFEDKSTQRMASINSNSIDIEYKTIRTIKIISIEHNLVISDDIEKNIVEKLKDYKLGI